MYIEKDNSHIVESGLQIQASYTSGHERPVRFFSVLTVLCSLSFRSMFVFLHFVFAFNLRSFQNRQISLCSGTTSQAEKIQALPANLKR